MNVIKRNSPCQRLLEEMTPTINRHAEFISASSRYDNNKTLKQVQGDDRMGFTLIEVLVVVLIIGVLAAVAVPQYQKAVLKSRFSSLMPTTKALRDGNEAHYMEKGRYAAALTDLDVTTQSGNEGAFELSNHSDYAYVLANRSDNEKNNLIMYQKHSANYPGETHCEALTDDTLANWLCETGLHATQNLGEVLTSGYTTYVLEGSGAGLPPGADDGSMGCDKAIEMGFTCSVNKEGTEKKICKNGICRTKTLNEDGGYTSVTCKANSENICVSDWVSSTYDANGNKTLERTCSNNEFTDGTCRGQTEYVYYDTNGNIKSQRWCKTVASDGTCSQYTSGHDYFYDAKGNKTKELHCRVNTDGQCSEYLNPDSSNKYYTYDADGNLTSIVGCPSVDSDGICRRYSLVEGGTAPMYYTYDSTENGTRTSERLCKTVNPDNGKCAEFNGSAQFYNADYTYDSHGNMTSRMFCVVNTVAADGTCTYNYRDSDIWNYTYDSNGNMTSKQRCADYSVTSDGTCSKYDAREEYTYDDNGNQTSSRYCVTIAADGTCSAYGRAGTYYNYTYDTTEITKSERACRTVASDGTCSEYQTYGIDYTYDTKGNETSRRLCKIASDGTCSEFPSGTDYLYDEDGKQIGKYSCSGANMNPTTGECIKYNGLSPSNY